MDRSKAAEQQGSNGEGRVAGRFWLMDASGHRLGLYQTEQDATDALNRRPDAIGGSVAPAATCDICGRALRPEATTRCAPCIVNVSQWRDVAADRGRDAADAAASWTTDGNTKTEFIPDVLRMIEEGDPAASDYLPAMPTLSGEWAGDPTPQSLARDIAGEDLPGLDIIADELAEAWEEAVAETFESACAANLRAAIGGE